MSFAWISVVLCWWLAISGCRASGPTRLHQFSSGNPRCDPASSWLAYAKADGKGRTVSLVNATWKVPSYPKHRMVLAQPGFWFGIEPSEPNSCDLIQPILAYGYNDILHRDYCIFVGYYQWDNSSWWYSTIYSASPGDTIYAFVSLDPSGKSYTQGIRNLQTNKHVEASIQIEQGKGPYSDAYFVVEHQPESCSEMPASGGMSFTSINIQYVGSDQSLSWSAKTWQDVCSTFPTVINNSTVSFTWKTANRF
jgi:hypothetical protein